MFLLNLKEKPESYLVDVINNYRFSHMASGRVTRLSFHLHYLLSSSDKKKLLNIDIQNGKRVFIIFPNHIKIKRNASIWG